MAMLCITSCGKDDEDPIGIQGDWTWVSTFNPWSGTDTPETSGDQWSLDISTSTFSSERVNSDGTVIEESTTYTVEMRESIYSTEPLPHVVFSGEMELFLGDGFSYQIEGDTLHAMLECFDCPSFTFVRD